MVDGCDFFIRSVNNELYLQKQMAKETAEKLESQNKEMKQELSTLKDKTEERL